MEKLKKKDARDYGQTKGTLLPDFELEADIVVNEQRYLVRRTCEGMKIYRGSEEHSEENLSFDVRSLMALRVYSQGQIASIAKDPTSLRDELDALVEREKLTQNDEQRRSTIDRLKHLQATRLRLKEKQKTLPAKNTELQKVNDLITFLEQKGQKKMYLYDSRVLRMSAFG